MKKLYQKVHKTFIDTLRQYKLILNDKSLLLSCILGFVLVAASLIINYFAGKFATSSASSSVTDIILDHVRVWDVTFIFVEGAIIFWCFVAIVMLLEPKRIPFVTKSVALFIVIRSIFISLTHLAPFSPHLELPIGNMIARFTFGGDLFFSAHTGAPFLFALIFWDEKWVRYTCLVSSFIFGIAVLLGHLHYSIDVFAAFFITFAIYHIAIYFFKHDFELFKKVSGKILETKIEL